MERIYKYTHLPEGYSALAQAAWLTLSEFELYEVNGKLIFTDDIDVALGKAEAQVVVHEFPNHEAFEKWLLECVTDWCQSPDDTMLQELGNRINLA